QQLPHVHPKRLLLLPARPCRVSAASILDREPATRRGSGRDATAAQIDLLGTAQLSLRRAEGDAPIGGYGSWVTAVLLTQRDTLSFPAPAVGSSASSLAVLPPGRYLGVW